MENNNSDIVFLLDGLNASVSSRRAFFGLALTSYVLTLLVNVTLVVTVCVQKSLHEPLYVFLSSLCVNGVLGASTFYPKLLHDLLAAEHAAPYAGCLAQIFFVYLYVFVEYGGLTVMALDRYLAICRPLRYRGLMTWRAVAALLLLTWSASLAETLAGTTLTARLPLCGWRIGRLYCSNWAVVKLACRGAGTAVNNAFGFVLVVVHVSQAGLILASYVQLVRASLRSRADRRKFVQTCVPHLATLLVFNAALLFDIMHERYGGAASLPTLRHAAAAEFLVVPPLINPIIYGINLQQIRSKILPAKIKAHNRH